MKLLLKNGTIVTSDKVFKEDILIENGLISKIGKNLEIDKGEVVDLCGKYVMPGGVDAHTHFNLDVGIAIAKDDFYTGTVAAACGGTTTIIDHMGFGPEKCTLHHQLNKYKADAEKDAVIDYGFHGVIQHLNREILEEMESMVKDGVTSFKAYMTYDNKLQDEEIEAVMERLSSLGAMTTIHAEAHEEIIELREKYIAQGKTAAIYHAKSRPVKTEVEAIKRMIEMSKEADDAPLYIVHLSSGDGLDVIKKAKAEGRNVYAETCPQYLFLDDERYLEDQDRGLKYIMSPPLREKSNNERLWSGIADGNIQTVATDHCPFDFKLKKELGSEDFTKCPNGGPGVETRIALMYSEGVGKNRISINKFVDVVSTAPAKLFGLYPKKGSISIGADADLMVIDPEKQMTIKHENLHENVDHTLYEGMKLKGYPVMTISRGEIIVKNNKFIGQKGRGRYLKRKTIF
ncbi:dihydropyrimidinase [uncultured Ilyobacter sp.]|uniref:dihydropyrimidinase n=1 Tax=uncultured Ilyobacter sp. TaxID=544433 RepID=UPI0029C0B5A2|nr:dihydropyrimidinase [uncultured Ilyobacter sp.]